MKIPDITCKIEMTCPVNPSEDPDKVKMAVSNILPYSTISNENYTIKARSDDIRSLEKISESVSSNRSQRSCTRNLKNNLDGDTTWLLLNKQAAFVDRIAVCDTADESPLGPIMMNITSPNIEGIIDWISL